MLAGADGGAGATAPPRIYRTRTRALDPARAQCRDDSGSRGLFDACLLRRILMRVAPWQGACKNSSARSVSVVKQKTASITRWKTRGKHERGLDKRDTGRAFDVSRGDVIREFHARPTVIGAVLHSHPSEFTARSDNIASPRKFQF